MIFFSSATAQEARPWSLEEIFASSAFAMKSLSSVQWMNDGRKFSYLETDSTDGLRDLYVYHVADGRRELVIDGAKLSTQPPEKPMSIASYEWSTDGERVLITGSLPARQVKTGGNFGVFDLRQQSFRLLSATNEEQAIIKFSPDGSRIGFVRGNNLYVMNVSTGTETQLTTDGSETILNGKFDWVYEEEFSIIDGWEWSPDGKRIAFWRLDQSPVPTFPLIRYPMDEGHPTTELMRYPKAGDPNSLVKIGVIDVSDGETVWMDIGTHTDIYIPRIQWTNDPTILSIQHLNRGQDTLRLFLANVLDGTTQTVLMETDTAWLDVENGSIHFLQDRRRFLWTSFRDGYNHIYLYQMDGTLERQVTKGPWEVTSVVAFNERRGLIYFMSTQASLLERHLYSIKLNGTGLRKLTVDPGWHSVNFSPDHLVFIDSHSSVRSPTNMFLRTNDGTLIARLVKNDTGKFRPYRFGEHKFFAVTTKTGDLLNAWMITPQDFDPTRRYPVLMYVYGGAGSQTVINSWGGSRYLWYQLLAEKGYIIVSVDNRGTGARGKAFMQQVHRRYGLSGVEDYVETARYLSTLSYVDSTRIGIWGWSGGGYMTCLALTIGGGQFRTGVAVAPVTDWKFYDSIYTERYMDTPADNPEGYRLTSAVARAAEMTGNLLIIHGTTDDNVHWQNTITFVDALIAQGKQVRTMFYPGRAHGISGGRTTLHVYTLITDFLLENL
jgi:dipeptidyl-peptidase-4